MTGSDPLPIPSLSRSRIPAPHAGWITAVVPAAGLGTRFLPTTKSVPKELLPVGDTPGIEVIAEEAAHAGAQRLLLVTSPGKGSVVDHFMHDPALEQQLTAAGKHHLVDKVRHAPDLLTVAVTVQEQPLGLGHAVGCAEAGLDDGEDAIAVLLPDDLVRPVGVLDRMAQVRRHHGGSVLCAVSVPRDAVAAYGVFDVGAEVAPGVHQVRGMVEKPSPGEAPSTLAAAGRYLLDRAVFGALRRIAPGRAGELQLTDAIALLVDDGHPVHVVVHEGTRHDLGTPSGYVRALVDSSLDDPHVGPGLRAWLDTRLDRDPRLEPA